MKKLITIFAFLSLATGAFSQAPDGINYQAVIRDNAGAVLTNSPVGMKIAIRQTTATGTVVYEESFAPTTSAYGLVNIVVGQGTVISGDFTTIDWASGPYFVEVSADETGGTNYAVLGTQQLMSVPYALYANTAENVTNDQVDDADADPTNELQDISLSGTDLSITNGSTVDLSVLQDGTGTDDQNISGSNLSGTNLTIGIENGTNETVNLSSLVDDADADPTNEYNMGAILTGTTLDIIDAGGVESVDLSSLQDGTGTDDQNISGSGLAGTNLTIGIEGGGSQTVDLSTLVDDADADPTNEIQSLTLNGTILSINGGNSIDLAPLLGGGSGSNQETLIYTTDGF